MGQEAAHHGHAVAQTRGGDLLVDAEPVELVLEGSASYADLEPTSREHVGHTELAGETERVVVRDHEDGGAEADPLGAAGRLDRHHERRGTGDVVNQVVLGKPGHPEASLVGQLDHLEGLLVDRRGRERFVETVTRHEQPEVHVPSDQRTVRETKLVYQ